MYRLHIFPYGVIHKVRTIRFCNFRALLPSYTCSYAFSLYPSSLIRAYGYYFLKKIWERYCELLPIKEPQTTLQNKETTVQNYWKIWNQNTKKIPGLDFALFNCTREMGMHNFGYLNSWLSLFYFYFVTNPRNLWRMYVYSWTSPSPVLPTLIQANTFLAGISLPLQAYVHYGWPLFHSDVKQKSRIANSRKSNSS